MRFTSFLLFCKQSYLAQKSLDAQLQRLGELSSTECISISNEDFEIFKTRRVNYSNFLFCNWWLFLCFILNFVFSDSVGGARWWDKPGICRNPCTQAGPCPVNLLNKLRVWNQTHFYPIVMHSNPQLQIRETDNGWTNWRWAQFNFKIFFE